MVEHKHKITELKIPIRDVSNLPNGSLNYVYRGIYDSQDVILKIYNDKFRFKSSEERFRNELEMLKKQNEIVVPNLIAYSERDKWIITSFVPGQGFEDNKNANLPSLVQCLKQLHRLDEQEPSPKYFRNLIHDLELRVEESEIINPLYSSLQNAIFYLRKEKKNVKNKLNRVHGDLNRGSIIFGEDNNVKAIVDWEFSHIGNIYQDLAQLTNRGDDRSKEILDRYFGKTMDKATYDFFVVYFLAKIVAGNSPANLKKMAFINKEKLEIVEAKKRKLMGMF